MTYDEICEKIEIGDYNDYTDMNDINIEISLIEYSPIRNPKTNECLFWIDDCKGDLPNDDHEMIIKSVDISIDDIKEYLEKWATDGFFSFIGSDKQKELDQLDNDYLAGIIQSITMYDGHFTN